MLDDERPPKDAELSAALLGLLDEQTSKAVVDILLDYREELVRLERAGVKTIALWNTFRSRGLVTASYQRFSVAMNQFRELVGLPGKGRAKARRQEKAAPPATPTAREGARNGDSSATGRQPTHTPPAPAARRSTPVRVPSNIPVPAGSPTERSLHDIALEKANAPGTGDAS